MWFRKYEVRACEAARQFNFILEDPWPPTRHRATATRGAPRAVHYRPFATQLLLPGQC